MANELWIVKSQTQRQMMNFFSIFCFILFRCGRQSNGVGQWRCFFGLAGAQRANDEENRKHTQTHCYSCGVAWNIGIFAEMMTVDRRADRVSTAKMTKRIFLYSFLSPSLSSIPSSTWFMLRHAECGLTKYLYESSQSNYLLVLAHRIF